MTNIEDSISNVQCPISNITEASDYIIDASKKEKKGELPFDDENK